MRELRKRRVQLVSVKMRKRCNPKMYGALGVNDEGNP
jgi:hypothetical protein